MEISRELDNVMLKVKFYECEKTEEEYVGCTWQDPLAPHVGWRVRP